MMITRSGRPPVGEIIDVPEVGQCAVESNNDPSLIALRTEAGAVFRIGERALARLLDSPQPAE